MERMKRQLTAWCLTFSREEYYSCHFEEGRASHLASIRGIIANPSSHHTTNRGETFIVVVHQLSRHHDSLWVQVKWIEATEKSIVPANSKEVK